MKVLFVCTGNTCRSPMAECCCRALSSGKKVVAASAGIAADEGACASSHAVTVCAEQGMELGSFRSRQLTPAMLQEADVVFGMTEGHLRALRQIAPESAAKVRLLGAGVPDPWGGDLECYRNALAAIRAGVEEFLQNIPSY